MFWRMVKYRSSVIVKSKMSNTMPSSYETAAYAVILAVFYRHFFEVTLIFCWIIKQIVLIDLIIQVERAFIRENNFAAPSFRMIHIAH